MATNLKNPKKTKRVYTSRVSMDEKVKIILDFCKTGQELTR